MTKPLSRSILARIRLVQVRPVADNRAAVGACLERLRVALRQVAADQEHAHVPYISFRQWLAGDQFAFSCLAHPAWHELLTLVAVGTAQHLFVQVGQEVLRERFPLEVISCDGCRKATVVAVCEIDPHHDSVLCPRCAEEDLNERLNRRHAVPGKGKVAA